METMQRTPPNGSQETADWRPIVLLCLLAFALTPACSQQSEIATRQTVAHEAKNYIAYHAVAGGMALASSGSSAPLFISSRDYPGVRRVAQHLQDDIQRVTSVKPELLVDALPAALEIVLIGTLGKNPLIDSLVAQKRLAVEGIAGRWETFLIQIVEQPFPNVQRALVIAGSDKRGTLFGMFDLSASVGVSPWYWWADVPVRKQPDLYVRPGRHTDGEPAVRYRGIFINDEAPALSGWAHEKFGGFNHTMYERVFELILRLKGNYLWPAMWGRAFYVDDEVNPALADEYGIVIGTSHHEPMMRAHAEWGRGPGTWNYQTNEALLKEFWREGIQRMGSYESVITLGMRGDGDEPMSEGANIALLERIVRDQRSIIADVTGRDVTAIPQVWALYKEVQEYYDKGMRVPDDVTLLLCDDNWGNIRKLPKLEEKARRGGYGIYYHYDYVGGPRNYKWLNTNQIARVWEQMHLAYEYGARQLWIVNVGDIKPMEFPISFFLDYAWDPARWPAESLPQYVEQWSAQQFGPEHATAIAGILNAYTTFNARRKPELLSPTTYSLVNYREAETVVQEYAALAEEAQRISDALPAPYQDAFYQLVLFPVLACANVNDLYVTVGTNHLYARQGRSATNAMAERARRLYDRDSALTYQYNRVMAGGKWNHMMDQTHIGYTSWQQPDENAMPEVKEIALPEPPVMGIAIEGSEAWWPMAKEIAVLPGCDNVGQQKRAIEVFNRGRTAFRFRAEAGKPWLHVTPSEGEVQDQVRLLVSVDWEKVPEGTHQVPITIIGPGDSRVVVQAPVRKAPPETTNAGGSFFEGDGYVSIEAEHFSKAEPPGRWLRIPHLGRTLSGMTPVPVTVGAERPGQTSPRLEYRIVFVSQGEVRVSAYLSPTLNFHNTSEGLRYAVSFDDAPPHVVGFNADGSLGTWERWVADNINITVTTHRLETSGVHVLKFWMVDPGVVLQKLVVEAAGVKPSYLGPPESPRRP